MLNLEPIARSLGFKLAIIVFFFGFCASAQDMKVVTKITKDSVCIKWLPTNFGQLVEISKGAKISRIVSTQTSNFNSLDFSNGKVWNITPMKPRYEALNEAIPDEDKMIVLADPILNGATADQENFAFGMALIENVSNPRFQYLLGNVLVDYDLKGATSFVYRIEVGGQSSIYAAVNTKEVTQFSAIDLELELDQKKTVVASWNHSDLKNESFAYDIEHATVSKKEGNFLSDIPFMPFVSEFENKPDAEYRHENVAQGMMHFYRIIGRDAFGEQALYSEWKEIYVPDKIEGYVWIDSVANKGKEREVFVRIQDGKRSEISAVELWRSSKRDQDFTKIASNPFTDSSLVFKVMGEKITGDHYYYTAKIVNKDDSVSSLPFYFFTLDQEPPQAPTEITVLIDSAGIVTLNWQAPSDDDIQGYRVFRGNQKAEEFVEKSVRLSTETKFYDTLSLNNLTSEVYYYIQTVDLNYNQSVHSDTVLGLKPDTIAPVPCVLKEVVMTDFGLQASWINSDSEDAVKSILYRNGTVMNTASMSTFADSTVEAGKSYTYFLVTEDRSGNSSTSNKIYKLFEPGYREALICKGSVDLQKHGIQLSWNLKDASIYSIEIYRAKGEDKPSFLKAIHDPMQTSFFDSNVRLGEIYTYSIKYITTEGIHSVPANVVVQY